MIVTFLSLTQYLAGNLYILGMEWEEQHDRLVAGNAPREVAPHAGIACPWMQQSLAPGGWKEPAALRGHLGRPSTWTEGS